MRTEDQTFNFMFDFQRIYEYATEIFPEGSRFVEVGSCFGASTSFMTTCIDQSKKHFEFYCVDTWEYVPPHTPSQVLRRMATASQGAGVYYVFLEHMLDIGMLHLVTPIRLPSVVAAKLFPDKSIDFVFIDGDHTYSAVKDDLLAWLPKIRENGVFAGHDYNQEGVHKAVNEIIGEENIGVFSQEKTTPILENSDCWTCIIKDNKLVPLEIEGGNNG